MKRVFSGIQPSGEPHLGNYAGALMNWVRLQQDYECIYCVVDYHAITQSYEPEVLGRRTIDMATAILAAGVDPERATLFVQSAVPEHTELAWLLNCVTPLGELERMTQFKDKSARNRKNINAGLLNYPVLQAADIVLYKAALVPVGEDQVQHLELSREIVRRFNARFGDVFPEPEPLLSTAKRILGLDGQAKMSKSLGNTLAMLAEEDEIWEKLRPAVTDARRVRRSDPGEPEDCNIFTIHKAFTPEDKRAELAAGCRGATIGCIDCKRVLADNLNADLAPVRERYRELQAAPERVREILAAGAERCRALARETLAEARQAMGLPR
ncbi:MAG: tryptophan--tRNA ligase [Candidatus Krumholzibacteriia bacterium]|nr:tryptophan--tRNA ligase [bacterium]MCB9515257.1 tryptophan--tRNA ligase [Candidatus Latescibacterota bacterium]